MEVEKTDRSLNIWLEPDEIVALATKRYVLEPQDWLPEGEGLLIRVSRDRYKEIPEAVFHIAGLTICLTELRLPVFLSSGQIVRETPGPEFPDGIEIQTAVQRPSPPQS